MATSKRILKSEGNPSQTPRAQNGLETASRVWQLSATEPLELLQVLELLQLLELVRRLELLEVVPRLWQRPW